jgi:hypothetical protein
MTNYQLDIGIWTLICHWELDNWTLPDLPAGRQEGWLPLLDEFPARGGQAQLD